MTTAKFTLNDLKRILLDGAGADDAGDLGGDILDRDFVELGYDSLALLETGGRIEREFAITLDDSVLIEASTPRSLIEAVNDHIATFARTLA
jgi:act minimal PKS acyl carrier protein